MIEAYSSRSKPYQVIQVDHTSLKNVNAKIITKDSIRPERRAGNPTVCDIRALQYPGQI